MHIVLLCLGAIIGVLFRYGALLILPFGVYSVIVVNVLGCFFLGFANTLKAHGMIQSEFLHMAITVGTLGAFTTFSTFINDIVQLYIKKDYGTLGIYFALSLVLAILFLALGIFFANKIHQ